jgi:hypothetical protein
MHSTWTSHGHHYSNDVVHHQMTSITTRSAADHVPPIDGGHLIKRRLMNPPPITRIRFRAGYLAKEPLQLIDFPLFAANQGAISQPRPH